MMIENAQDAERFIKAWANESATRRAWHFANAAASQRSRANIIRHKAPERAADYEAAALVLEAAAKQAAEEAAA